MMSNQLLNNKIKGSLVGGAIGDALGYPVEFMSIAQICRRYGEQGITRFALNGNDVAEISDDTQMTLFTANGLLLAQARKMLQESSEPVEYYIRKAYLDWLQTQTGGRDSELPACCWIRDISELNSSRAPGNTCMSALLSIREGSKVINNSKGCGGIMRVAPVALIAASQNAKNACRLSLDDIVKLGGETARITHKHPLGYLPAALMTYLVYHLILCEHPTSAFLEQQLADGFEELAGIYSDCLPDINYLKRLINNAVELAHGTHPDAYSISEIGEGWTGEEALAIAVYCSIRHFNDFEKAVVAAVNHSGDSDSTGAITGNIVGAIVGYEAIPSFFKEKLELRSLIETLADDLFDGCVISEEDGIHSEEQQLWYKRYVKAQI